MFNWFLTEHEEYMIIREALEKVTTRPKQYKKVLASLKGTKRRWAKEEEFETAFVKLFYSQSYKTICCFGKDKGLGPKAIEKLDRAYALLNG